MPASAMRRFFRRVAPYAAGAVLLATLPFPLKRKQPAAAGYLGLVRARPGLEGLSAALTRETFLLDAAYASGAGVFRAPIHTAGLLLRSGPGSIVSQRAAVAESGGDAERAAKYRLILALLDASDGRVEEALRAVTGLARERPADPEPRLAAGALCYLLGRAGDGEEWLESIPEALSQEAAVPSLTSGKGVGVAGVQAPRGCGLVGARELRHVRGGYARDLRLSGIFYLELFRLALSVLLRTKPPSSSSGEVLAEAERELARVEAEGDAGAAADVNLLLAARGGDFDAALGRYAQAARADPSDLRPYMLAAKLCRLTGRVGELEEWRVRAQHLRLLHEHDAAADEAELRKLLDELAVAVALGHGALTARGSGERGAVMLAAWREVDAGTVALLQSKELRLKQRLMIKALWLILKPALATDPAIQEVV
ncbi:unnamed protein product [Urochloa decumbens]|uniref:Uncharacterized protein n=1 Tax=Urochloa decumbens TaxID=240449 RepID=A0ABC8Z8I2_9POAL